MSGALAVFRREARLALRQSADSVMVVAFFIIAVVLFPFGVGPEPNTLARIGPGVIWVAALLAAMLSMERMYQADYEDWLTTGLPLMVATPLLAIMMNVPLDALPVILLTLALGTPILSLIGAIGAALVLGARRGGVLLSLLVLPLTIPVLIFAELSGLAVKAHLMLLGGLLLAAAALTPWASAAAVREAVA